MNPAGNTSQIAPHYRNGCRSYLTVSSTRADASPVRLAIVANELTEDPGLYDATTTDHQGYGYQQTSTRTASFDITAMWRYSAAAPELVMGGQYYARIYPGGTILPYEGVVILGPVKTKIINLKGDQSYSTTCHFQGVFNTPAEPTRIADYLSQQGKFSPTYVDTNPDYLAALAPPAAAVAPSTTPS